MCFSVKILNKEIQAHPFILETISKIKEKDYQR